MTGEAHWLEPTLVILGGLAIAFLAWSATWGGHVYRVLRERIFCPGHEREVSCTLVEDQVSGRITDVQSCSVFPDPNDVRCAKGCVAVLNANARRHSLVR